MKTVILLIVFSMTAYRLHAEYLPKNADSTKKERKKLHSSNPPFSYIGMSAGINNPGGAIGFDFNIPVANYLVLGTGMGISTWGNKVYVEGLYFIRPNQLGWAITGGVSEASGNDNFKGKMETIKGTKDMVTLNLHAVGTVFLGIHRYWRLGRGYNRFFAHLGWSVPIRQPRFKEIDGAPLTQASIDRINLRSPGGLIVGFGFSFGLHHHN